MIYVGDMIDANGPLSNTVRSLVFKETDPAKFFLKIFTVELRTKTL